MNTLPSDYEERVYAGVLGKIIGVYLGRPFEGWSHEQIERELGEINYYVHEKRGVPLVVADDDISGTFTFLRALNDHGVGWGLTSEMIGRTWLNYLVENRTVLWWGGLGVSTEHTAYLRLKNGIRAPESGSMVLNGATVAEQIGAQIFIDGWAMVCPGDPEKAVYLAGEAARVSHDGEAVFGAQVIAAMEAQAFVESDINVLLNTATSFIPRASLIYTLIQDIREWHHAEPRDWRATLAKVQEKWGYDRYGGGCHMLPNHALIILSLLYGEDDFGKSLMIVNTSGYDTDCNSGNVGCLLGIKNGLTGIERGADFRGPVADRLYLPSADGGRCISDALRETYEVVNAARGLRNLKPVTPKNGARFHFQMPGAVQGFMPEDSAEVRGCARMENVPAREFDAEAPDDDRVLALRYDGCAPGRAARFATPTFAPPDAIKGGGYGLAVSPTLYPGQIVRARLFASEKNARSASACLFVRVYGKDDKREILRSEPMLFAPGDAHSLNWEVPNTDGKPIAEVGVEIGGSSGNGTICLDWMDWTGAPRVLLDKPEHGTLWRRAWVNAVSDFREWGTERDRVYALVQNEGEGMVTQGESTWTDYTVFTEGHTQLGSAWGVVACGRGLRRYVALLLDRAGDGTGVARLIERYDDVTRTLDECPIEWDLYQTFPFVLTTRRDGTLTGQVGDNETGVSLGGQIAPNRANGAIGLLVRDGHCQFGTVRVMPDDTE